MSALAGRIGRAKERIIAGEDAVLVAVETAAGSVPRGVGTVMVVFADDSVGTIGGGALEYAAERRARAALAGGADLPDREIVPLGPAIGQCCGGSVGLRFIALDTQNLGLVDQWRHDLGAEAIPLWLFGAGHVGQAIARAVAPLPFHLTWIDSRPCVFPDGLAPDAATVVARAPHLEVGRAPAPAVLLVLTHSHAQDFDIVDAALRRADLGFVGLIGSATKRARFIARLRARGRPDQAIRRLVCPIGVAGVAGKEPEIIAASVATQLLQIRETVAAAMPVPASRAG
jgi:xanthine dehydrogenase accessory factor